MYVTQQNLKDYTGLNWIDSQIAFVDLAIESAQTYVENYCGDKEFGKRIFANPYADGADPVTKLFNGSGSKRLYVGDLFSLSSLSIENNGVAVDSEVLLYPLNNPASGFAYDSIEISQINYGINLVNSRAKLADPFIFEADQSNIAVTGYWYYSDTPPADVKMAVLKLAGAILRENFTDDDVRGKLSESLGEYSVSYQKVSEDANRLGIAALLEPYVRKPYKKQGSGYIQV